MIIDRIQNRAYYEGMHPDFSLAFDWIERAMREEPPTGRYALDGDRVYAMVQEYEGKEDHEIFEGHRRYLDIQFILSGRESMEAATPAACDVVPLAQWKLPLHLQRISTMFLFLRLMRTELRCLPTMRPQAVLILTLLTLLRQTLQQQTLTVSF